MMTGAAPRDATIVLVDDDVVALGLLEHLLAQLTGCRTVTFESAREALAFCLRDEVDLVITDLSMPGLSGIDLLGRLRGAERTRDVPVIMVTALSDRDARNRALEMGANDYLVKPMDAVEVRVRTRNLLALRKAGRALADRAGWLAEEVQRATAQLRAIIDVAPVPIALTDDQWNVTLLNPAFVTTFGYTREDIPTIERWWTTVCPDPAMRRQVTDTIRSAIRQARLAGSAVLPVEFDVTCRSGAVKTVLASSSSIGMPLTGAQVVVLYDITERKQAEKQKEELEALLRQSQKMEAVGQLAGGVAHDFNNLLTVINGGAELALGDLREGDPLREGLQEIRQAGQRAAALTRQLLAFSRRQVLRPELVCPDTLVAGMLPMLRRLIREDIRLVVVPADEAGSILADPGQIEQVIMNLAINARDAMPGGGVLTIETQLVQLDRNDATRLQLAGPGRYVVLSVGDTGTGMDEATRLRIFEPFFTTKGMAGTGLGLSTVFGITRQSRGAVSVSSELGKGSEFRIYLPCAAGDVLPGPATQRKRPASRGAETILLVDDEKSLVRMGRRILESAGYTVLTAGDGAEALLRLEQHDGPVHLLLTDVVIPVMSGPDLAARIAHDQPAMKVLFMSGYADDVLLARAAPDDATHFLAKPYTIDELTRKVREVLDEAAFAELV